MIKKSKPQRLCVGCREMKDKRELIRVVKTPNDEICIDPTGKMSGRGAYVCRNVECLEKALKHKGLEKSLKTSIGDAVRGELTLQLSSLAGGGDSDGK